MSRHLLIRCDAPGCTQQTETSARDDEPTSIAVPSGWLTLIAPERHHRHYCSEACIGAAFASKVAPLAGGLFMPKLAAAVPVVEPAPAATPEPPSNPRKTVRHVANPA